MKRPCALVVCAYFPFPQISGGRKRAVRLMEAMDSAGARPHILAVDVTAAGREEAEARGWMVEGFPAPRYDARTRVVQHLARQVLAPSPRLWARIAELGPSSAFVQLEELEALVYVPISLRTSPTVASPHNVDSEARRPTTPNPRVRARAREAYHLSRMRFQETRAVRRSRATLCVSTSDQAHFADVGARRTVLTPNGVDRSLFELPLIAADPPSVLFFGQISWRPNYDGLDRFLRSGWPRVRASIPNARLRIVGPGVANALRERGALEPGVDVIGLVDDIETELRRARTVVVPIWTGGGTRLKVLEAMASARTVVGTSLGVAGIGFVDGEHGLLADEPGGLAARLVEVLADGALARRLGEAARSHAHAFEWTKATAAAERLYAELCDERAVANRTSATHPPPRPSRSDGA